MFLTRNGYFEETFFTFSLSPVRGESGGIDGLFHPVTETTSSMLAERRTRALRDLTASLAAAPTVKGVLDQTVLTLENFAFDLPCFLIYRLDEDANSYTLVKSFGVSGTCIAVPARLPADVASPWPITLNMAFHELASNVAKYGALQGDAGSVDISWSVDSDQSPPEIAVDWREKGGPSVGKPSRRGFGSRLLQQGVGRELGPVVI